jgi:subtilisin family serine protease
MKAQRKQSKRYILKNCYQLFFTAFLVWCSLSFTLSVLGQSTSSQVFISFKDKKNTPYSFQTPLNYLSDRSIQRRLNQNIALDSSDLPVNPAYVDSLKSKGALLHGISKWLNGVIIDQPSAATLAAINTLPFVKNSQAVKARLGKAKQESKMETNFQQATAGTSDYSNYGAAANQIEQLHGTFLHQQGYTGAGMQISILDAGFDRLNRNPVFVSTYSKKQIDYVHDFVSQDDSVYDNFYHGEMVFSTMATNKPGVFIGTAPDANFNLLRTEDEGSENLVEEYYWALGAEKADSLGTDLINSSLGYNEFDGNFNNHSFSDMNGKSAPASIAAELAAKKGILVVVSAGNEGKNPWKRIGTPADANLILTVGAVQLDRAPAGFSSYGPSADNRIKPEVAALGQNASLIDPTGQVVVGSGTSFASPILCGMAACLWQKYPTRTAQEVRSAIMASAHLYHAPSAQEGYGIPNFEIAELLLSNPNNPVLDKTHPPVLLGNPYTNETGILVYSKTAQTGTYWLYNISGQLLAEVPFNTDKETYSIIPLSNLNELIPGNYLIQVMINDELSSLQLTK